MKKSIEIIWKTGFLHESISAPIINDLYNQKSIHAIDRYIKRFKFNMKAIFGISFVVLFISLLLGIPMVGIPMFLMLNIMVIVDYKLLKKQKHMLKGETCYEFIKSLHDWMSIKTKWNIIVARIMYPVMFTSILLGQWFINIDGTYAGKEVTRRLLEEFPNMALVFGVPLLGFLGLIVIDGLLVILAKKLYMWDLNIAYGNLLRKLDELMMDMEELRN